MVRLTALGNSRITTSRCELGPNNEVVFAAALYLVLERGRKIARRSLEELLWPGLPDNEKTRHRLRQTLHKLKQADFPIRADRVYVNVPAEEVETDFDSLLSGASHTAGAIEDLTFLPGYAPGFSTAFAHWLDCKRDHVNSAITSVISQEIRSARARGDWARVESLALKSTELDPFNEEIVLVRAEAAAMRGAKIDALEILDSYVRELGPGADDIKIPASIMRRRIAERSGKETYRTNEIPFVGRQSEMGQLHQLFEETRESRGSTCLIVGEAGSGKSRVAMELAHFATLQGSQVQRAQSHPTDLHRPLSVFVDLVPSLLQMRGAIGCSEDTLEVLKRLTQHESRSDAPPVHTIDAEVLYARLRQAFFDLFDAVTEERCVIIIIDDVHWLDPESAKVLVELNNWCARKSLMLVLTSRAPRPEWTLYNATARLSTVILRAVSDRDAETMVRSLIPGGRSEDAAALLEWCLPLADGNPFFLQELTRHWLETRGSRTLPPSLADVIAARLERLRPEAMQLLQVCVLLGRHSTIDRVESVLGVKPHELLRSIDELATASMLAINPAKSTRGEERITSRHDLLSVAALETLSSQARRYLHRCLGKALEADIEDDKSAAILWDCADHWQKAGDSHRALNLARSCARHMLGVGLVDESADALERALKFADESKDQLDILEELVSVLHLAGDWTRMQAAALRHQTILFATSTTANLHSDVELLGFEAAWRAAKNWHDILKRLAPCVSDQGASPAHRVRAAVIALKLASNLAEAEERDRIVKSVEHLLDDRSVDPHDRLEFVMILATERRHHDEAFKASLALTDYERRHGSTVTLFRALRNSAKVLRLSGDQHGSIRLLREGYELAREKNLTARLSLTMVSLAELYLQMGNIEAADHSYAQIIAAQFPMDDGQAVTEWRIVGARLALLRGSAAEAEELFCEAHREENADTHVLRRGGTLALLIRFQLAQEISPPAITPLVDELLGLQSLLRGVVGQDYETASLVSGLQRLGRHLEAKVALQEFAKVRADREPVLPELGCLFDHYGVVAKATGVPFIVEGWTST